MYMKREARLRLRSASWMRPPSIGELIRCTQVNKRPADPLWGAWVMLPRPTRGRRFPGRLELALENPRLSKEYKSRVRLIQGFLSIAVVIVANGICTTTLYLSLNRKQNLSFSRCPN